MRNYIFLLIPFLFPLSLYAGGASEPEALKKEILNCFRDQPSSSFPAGTKTYTAALRYDFLNSEGKPSVNFILVRTTNVQAKDEDLFSLSGFKLNPASKLISKAVLHGPTSENIKALVWDEKKCDNWMKEDRQSFKSPHATSD